LRAQAPANTDITVRHAWPPDWQRPNQGAWVLIQPWEFGVLPLKWIKQLNQVDEAWVPSQYVREVYLSSGVSPEKVKVLPNGIDPTRFHPEAEPMKLPTQKKFRFLFVGGTIHRKGPDVLLEAYLKTFTAQDDVCLVIKDFGGKDIYAGQTFEAQIQAVQARPNAPEILYLTEEISAEKMPSLYAACHCLAHPYRGEGFGLPVLEAMACALPVIVTGGGAADDFVGDDYAYRVASVRKHIGNKIADLELLREGWLLEPALEDFARRMRQVYEHQDEAAAKGKQASDYVRKNWTWERSAQIAAQLARELVERRKAKSAKAKDARAAGRKTIELPLVAKLGDLSAARALFAAKQYEQARKLTLEALRIRPFHPEAMLLMAQIYSAAGDVTAAKTILGKARAMAPKWKPSQQWNPAKVVGSTKLSALPERVFGGHRVSVCIITKNEEHCLGRCLESIQGLADQIVVVDTGSTDWTVDVAKRFGAEVYSFAWDNDFSAARNAALERATGDWVLILDADEELAPQSVEQLKKHLADSRVLAYRLPIIDIGKEEDGCHYVPRLFRNAPGLFFMGRVHEQAFSSIEIRRAEWGLENVLGKATLLHHGYTAEMVRKRNKKSRNLGLLERAVDELPNEPHLLMNYGMELIRCGHTTEGLNRYWDAFEAASELGHSRMVPEFRENLLQQFSTQLLSAKDYPAVVEVLTSPIARAGGLNASMHFSLGLAHLEMRQYAEAAEQFQQCLNKINKPALCPVNKDILKGGPQHCLALSQKMLKHFEKAAVHFEKALVENPGSRNIRQDYAVFLFELKQPIKALEVLYPLVQEHPYEVKAWLIGGQAALSHPECYEVARDWTAEAARYFPQHPQILCQRAEALFVNQQFADSLQYWPATLSDPRQAAIRAFCEVTTGRSPSVPQSQQQLVAKEFLHLYRCFVEMGASKAIEAINSNLASLRTGLPIAARILEQALVSIG
jgi:glycosyltransferase involved in cell wall biosynthesis/Tfp pilus assembly protein PilF